jgi:ribonucleotide reductase alpha subunit
MLKVPFGSSKAGVIREEVMSTIAREAYRASIDLAIEKGMFKECVPEEHAKNPFIQSLNLEPEFMNKLRDTGIRNSSLLSIQPTGNCVTKDSVVRLFTNQTTIEELITTVTDIKNVREGDVVKLDKPVVIPTFEGEDVFDCIYVNGFQEVLDIEVENNVHLQQTPNHKYLVKINEECADWIEAKDLKPGMKIIALVDE